MSHYTTVELEVKDQASFIQALCDVWPTSLVAENIEVHDTPQSLFGYQGDKRQQRANVIVRRKHVGAVSNDIGFLMEGGKATAFISEYDKSRYSSTWQDGLRQRYARNVAVKEATRKGYRVKETQTDDGKIKLVLTK